MATEAALRRLGCYQQPLPAFPRAAAGTIRFGLFLPSGSSNKVKSPARQPAGLEMFLLPSTSGRVVLLVRHLGRFAHCHQSGCGRANTDTPPSFCLEALAIKACASNFHLNLRRLISSAAAKDAEIPSAEWIIADYPLPDELS